jgi:protein-S-isoprenylcysteine O-methyltransferase Ste14
MPDESMCVKIGQDVPQSVAELFFFEDVQEDRGQTVVMTGPYRYVRHPMYAGLLILFPATSVVLGSWYGFVLALVLDGMFAVRAVLEELMLWEELNGYDAYTTKVKYRLIPYVW